jgi:hypothetical protein
VGVDQGVDARRVLGDALDQPDGVLGHRRVARPDPVAQHREPVTAAHVGLVEDVDGALACLGPCGHRQYPVLRRRGLS